MDSFFLPLYPLGERVLRVSEAGEGTSISMVQKNPRILAFAQELRHNQSEAERRMWNALRNRTLGGHKFSRQVPIDQFIADFVCREKKLIVELDGATHGEDAEVQYDERRTKFLESKGYRVCRVNNEEVYKNLGDVLDGILTLLEHVPSPAHSGHPLP
jgi:very-short-patch-repair endonuclease